MGKNRRMSVLRPHGDFTESEDPFTVLLQPRNLLTHNTIAAICVQVDKIISPRAGFDILQPARRRTSAHRLGYS